MLYEHRKQRLDNPPVSAEKMIFEGVGSKDVYNPIATIHLNGEEIMAARVESRHSETDSQVFFFRKTIRGTWEPALNAPRLQMQDPFVTTIGKETVIGGVEIYHKPEGGIGYKTVFYKGTTLAKMERFAAGPTGMKDIRLAEQENGKILVLTRPQGGEAGRGKIGVTEIDKLSDLTPQKISEAKLLKPQFANGEWGGANEIHRLKDGKVGVLGHIARFDAQGNRHYYPATFVLNPLTGEFSAMKILLERSEIPVGISKRPDLHDVLFSGGLKRFSDGTAELYVGAGDAETYRVRINDPFKDD